MKGGVDKAEQWLRGTEKNYKLSGERENDGEGGGG